MPFAKQKLFSLLSLLLCTVVLCGTQTAILTKANAAGDKQHFPFPRRRLPPAERKIDQGGERTRKKGATISMGTAQTRGASIYIYVATVFGARAILL